MPKGIGRRIQAGLAKEATRGTKESSADYWIDWSSLGIQERWEQAVDEAARGVIEGSQGATEVKRFAEGDLEAPIGVDHFGLVLLATLGSETVSTDDPVTGSNKHTFSVSTDNQHPSLSILLNDPLAGQDKTHARGMVDSLELSVEQGSFAMYTASFRSEAPSDETHSSISQTDETRFLPQHAKFKTANNKSGLSSASTTNLRSFSMTINKNLEDDDVLSSKDPQDFLNTQLTIEGEFEAIFQNESDFKNDATGDATPALQFQLHDPNTTVGGAGGSPKLTINLPLVKYTDFEVDRSPDDVVTQSVSFQAHFDTNNSEMIEAILFNSQSAY